jgi:hypothetical protein
MYVWDGRQWVRTLSPDGRYRWNGTAWILAGSALGAPYQPLPTVREPTSWTRPLQLTVIAWYVFSALYTLSIPLWMGGFMSQITNQMVRQQEATNGQPLPPGFSETMTTVMTTMFWGSALVGVILCAVAIIGALRRWKWIFYVILVFLALGALGLPIDLINAFGGGSVNAAEGFSLPAWTAWLGIVTSLVSGGLAAWMLIAAIRFGPWAMRRV